MDKKIGRVLFFICLLVVAYVCPNSLHIQILDSNNESTRQVGVNMPFVIEAAVTTHDAQQIISGVPEINGIKQLIIDEKTHVSTINSIVNGRRSCKKIYRFTVHADKIGVYTIGPAHITVNNQTIKSNVMSVAVVPQKQISKQQDSLLQVSVDKDAIYLGQSLMCSIRFYPGKSTTLDGITQPQFNDCATRPTEGPLTGSEVIDGVARDYVEWKTVVYPQKVGTLTIPAVAAMYKAIKKKKLNSFDIFDRLFDGGLEQKQIFSNIVSIDVKPLPPCDKPVHAVGSFDALSACVDHNAAQEGEAIVYRLTVEGGDSFANMQPPNLTMPEGLKYYESKSYSDNQQGKSRKHFEYIIQAIKPGNWEIPAQEFNFFDTLTLSYKTLTSNSIPLVIQKFGKLQQPENKDSRATPDKNSEYNQELVQIADGPWREQPIVQIPWYLFFIGCMMPCFYGLMHRYNIGSYARDNSYIKKKIVFRAARKKLRLLKKDNDISSLYVLFTTLFSDLALVENTSSIHESSIELLRKKGCSLELTMRWADWHNTLGAYRFGLEKYDEERKQIILMGARQWLAFLEKLL